MAEEEIVYIHEVLRIGTEWDSSNHELHSIGCLDDAPDSVRSVSSKTAFCKCGAYLSADSEAARRMWHAAHVADTEGRRF